MIAKNTSSNMLFVKSGNTLTYVVNILKGIPSLGISPVNRYEVHGYIAGCLFKVKSTLSLRHAYVTFKNLQALSDVPEFGSMSGIAKVVSVDFVKNGISIKCDAVILEDDYLL